MNATTLGELKQSGYQFKSIRNELRDNLIQRIQSRKPVFEGIFGYDQTVIPDVERAILSGHNILFLGLRGQAKTRMARSLVHLLDEYIPVIAGSEIHEDPLMPVTRYGRERIQELGDQCPINWIHRSERYVEKLATPDVSVADLIGDLDPIKAAQKKVSFDHEFAIHFGLVPKSNRSLFVINELPDLQARIQVALFNILEENDLQIRGFKLKLPLDIYFMFTANPEDYTQRGNIITPLKDRIESQILTHYPEDIETALRISLQEADIPEAVHSMIQVPELLSRIIEQIAFTARESEFIDEKSGVSARLSISALELLYSAVQRRLLINGEKNGQARLTDLLAVVPALTGKMELVYEGEQMGAYDVALALINEAIQTQCGEVFPPLPDSSKPAAKNPYQGIIEWFSKNNQINISLDASESQFQSILDTIPEVKPLLKNLDKKSHYFGVECLLHILAGANIIQKEWQDQRIIFKDQLASMLNDLDLTTN
ncbi:MAG TPA: magnesium chelatase [Saprospiraceae bacterium]|nr:magnesium chelatase [Saprospiraceae bacterium]